jgi:putative SOS response-associated peptidase YedK
MCGRYSRARNAQTYIAPLFGGASFNDNQFSRSWNIAPGSVQPVLYREGPQSARWGFVPIFANTRRPMVASSRLDDKNAATWKTMWRTARVVVPADGWYEWVVENGKQQPYFVRPMDDRPVYLAALISFAPDEQAQESDGFVVVTARAGTGIVDTHSHRPVVLSASDAVRWLDLKTSFSAAGKMVNESITSGPPFRWFRVSVGVNSVGNDEPAFNDPLPDDITA